MAMEMTEKVTFNGTSKIDGVVVEQYGASVDQMNPENLTFSRVILPAQAQVRKDNREQCRADQAAFEDDVYAVQDQMIAEDAVKEEVAEEIEEETEEK